MRLSRVVRCAWVAACFAFAASLATPRATSAQVLDPIQYNLSPPSHLEYGCYGACACPLIFSGPLVGQFTFYRTSVDPLFTHYALVNIDWSYALPGALPGVAHLRGHGTYEIGGEFALVNRMTLDVTTNDTLAQHFDSGVVPVHGTFPVIDILVRLHPGACLDSVLRIVAAPFGFVSVAPPTVSLLRPVRPNPTLAGAEIVLAQPSAGRVRVEVLGVDGRVVATLADGEFGVGEQRLHWDGRTARGVDGGAGLFWVRARMGPRVDVQRIVRLR